MVDSGKVGGTAAAAAVVTVLGRGGDSSGLTQGCV